MDAKQANAIPVALMRQIQARNQQALGTLYDRLSPLVNAVILRILGDQAEADEVLGETFWQVWDHAASYDPTRGAVEAWVITMARSRALDRLRARQRRAPTAAIEAKDHQVPASPETLPETAALQGERSRVVATALAELPEAQRRAIDLAYYEGLTQAEIAARLGQPLGTIKTRIRLGLASLRKALEPYRGERP